MIAVGDEVTVFTDDGKYHNFTVKECEGMTATFDCDPSFWEESHKYKLFYPSLAAGWLEDRGYVLTFGFHPENDAHKVADWFSSNWVNGGGNMKFNLKHLNSMMCLSIKHPHQGNLKQCYLRVPPIDVDTEKDMSSYNVFGYKITYLFEGKDFELDSESMMAYLPLVFDKKSFKQGEEMVSETPLYSHDYRGLTYHLILVYGDGTVYTAPLTLPDAHIGKYYKVSPGSDFIELLKEPERSAYW